MQITSSISSVTSTNGLIRINQPINPDTVVRSVADTKHIGIDSSDRNLYPVIRFDIVTKATQFWFYDIGDEATRDADLAIAESATSGGGTIFDYMGSLGNWTQSQNFGGGIGTSSAHLSTSQFAIPIKLSGTYSKFSMMKLASAFGGNINFAIYDSKTGSGVAGFPNNKIWQSPEFAVTVAKELLIATLTPNLTLNGIYWFSWHGDAAFTWHGGSEIGLLGYDISGTTMSKIARIFSTVAYAATLPDTWTAPINNSLAGIPPYLFQEKVI